MQNSVGESATTVKPMPGGVMCTISETRTDVEEAYRFEVFMAHVQEYGRDLEVKLELNTVRK
jgi:hypothetical protein